MSKITRETWARDMLTLSSECVASNYYEGKKHLLRFWHLLNVAPQPDLLKNVALPSAVRMQALLTADACDTAIMEIMGDDIGFTISRNGREPLLATVHVGEDDADCHGESPALALVAAIALALSRRGVQACASRLTATVAARGSSAASSLCRPLPTLTAR
jgi:hypothetical protein